MNNRTEAKLTDLSGMQKAIEEILKQAWERGRKYGQNEGQPIECDECEAKAKSYSMGFKDGYHTGGFDFVLLRRWLAFQGYSEEAIDDKIESFQKLIKTIREES